MPISEHFKESGVIVSGKIEAGKVVKGQALLMMPNKVISWCFNHYL
jgi:peptide chain release factor subunit 3